MARGALILVVAFVAARGVQGDDYAQEQLRRAIKDLGSQNFRVREGASQMLWLAGAKAEPILREALSSTDPEVLRRAKSLLEKFSWGLFPDTPDAIVRQIDRFREGEKDDRLKAVDQLLRLGKPGYDTLRRMAEKVSDSAEKQAIFDHVAREAQVALPGLVAAGDFANVRELLERCLLGGSDEAFTNYAAFQALDGKLLQSIERWESTWRNSKSPTAARLLVHLYRAKGDFPKSREFAKNIDSSLLEQVLWEQDDWKSLAMLLKTTQDSARDASMLGMRAAIYRLAGDRAAFDDAVAQLRKLAHSDDSFQVRSVAESLLLNGRVNEAMTILLDKNCSPALTFELLFTRMRWQEALKLAHSAHPFEWEEDFRLRLRYARALHLLGELEQAKQQFEALANSLKSTGQTSSARDLIKVLTRLELRDRATAVAARYMAVLQKERLTIACGELLEPLFDRDAEFAAEWWLFLREKVTSATPEQCMALVERIVAGMPVEHRDQWAAELAGTEKSKSTDRRPILAAAVAMLRAGKEEQARTLFELAIKHEPQAAIAIQYADWLAKSNRHRDAAEWYRRAGALEPGNALALFLRGVSLSKAGEIAEGKRMIELAHWVPLGDEYQRGQLIQELERRGFPDDAKREVDFVLRCGWYRFWHMGNILAESGRLAIKVHDYQRAIAAQEKAIAGCMWKAAGYVELRSCLTVPQDVESIRIRSLLESHQLDDALAATRAALDVLPGNYALTIRVVNALDAVGRKKDADGLFNSTRAQYDELCRQFPNCTFGHYRYALLAAGCDRELDKALMHAEAAVKLAANDPGRLDVLAEVHFRRGDSKRALALMTQCVASEPRNEYYRKQLARYQSGDRTAPMPEQDE